MPFFPGFKSSSSPQYSRISTSVVVRHLRTVTRLFLDNSKKTSLSTFLEGEEGVLVVDCEDGVWEELIGLVERAFLLILD